MKKILTPGLVALGLLANAQVMANSVTLIADSNY